MLQGASAQPVLQHRQQALLHLGPDGRRLQGKGQALAGRKRDLARQVGQDLVKLDRMKVFLIHYNLKVKISGGRPFGIQGRSVAIATGNTR